VSEVVLHSLFEFIYFIYQNFFKTYSIILLAFSFSITICRSFNFFNCVKRLCICILRTEGSSLGEVLSRARHFHSSELRLFYIAIIPLCNLVYLSLTYRIKLRHLRLRSWSPNLRFLFFNAHKNLLVH
jgi:hypothetical protein